jgi:hypothetical protein
MLLRRTLVTCVLLGTIAGASRAPDREGVIFAIGRRDQSFTEFSRTRDAQTPLVFRVGTSQPADWPAYHPGTFDMVVGRSTMERDWTDVLPRPLAPPLQITFDLTSPPHGSFVLHLDAIVRHRRPAAPRYVIRVNGQPAGSYRLDPHPAPELWWPNGGEGDGNLQYFGYATLDVTLPASLFAGGSNTIAVECVDGFGFYYDDLSLTNRDATSLPLIAEASVESTVLYKRRPNGLVEIATARLRTTRALGRTTLRLSVGSNELSLAATQDEAGDLDVLFEVPASDGPRPVTLRVDGIENAVYEGTFTPKRRWTVYALPMEQADFGYNDLPARTLEWENRFIDKALAIQAAHPSYSFTLDAAANLDSYLATRQSAQSSQLLGHLRSGRWGLNALYGNFFTGLMAPEELYRAIEFALRAGKAHGIPIDSASQTDEPSVTWAIPQVLADAGIKYFTNGSDPIRGALNPIGLLNFTSPFYWQAPNGSRVLMWSGVSYTAVDDMTWGGWNAEAVASRQYRPSILGLTRSLPLFLSQYERSDFPFDAVQLFGLHNDEIPMRHWGDADILDLWNREYAYPKIVAAPQRDFFRYITERFGDRIQTLKGDGGAYWEDEAGADARVAARIRAAQSQLVAAEIFESAALWLQPHLRFDPAPFEAAWRNVMLADTYVWSDANSFRRPDSYRTREGEAAHRAWADAAFQQTKDLRLVAMDKIAELVRTDRQGAVVFNASSQVRSGLFDFELEPDEVLEDPATGTPIPCGVVRSQHGYHDVRCLATGVPAMGYRFYATGRGRLSEGDPIALDPQAPAIEAGHYRLQLDPQTGAIAHLVDRTTNVDLVKPASPYRLNEYLYVTGGNPGAFIPGSVKDNRLLAADLTLPRPELTIHRATLTGSPEARRYPWGTIVTTRATATNTQTITSSIAILDAANRIEITNDVEKTATLDKEGIYFAFPFALDQPSIKYEGATAWVDPITDMLPGANRQWFTTQGGVWAKGANTSVAWATADAPLITIGDINRGTWPTSLERADGTLFSYVMNNYWYTDTPAQQGGHFTFRYALTSGRDISMADAVALSGAQRSPLVAIRRYSMGWEPQLDAAGTGFIEVEPANARVLTVRPLERGSYLVRIQNAAPDAATIRLRLPHAAVVRACVGSVLGECVEPISVTGTTLVLPFRGYDIKTVVISLRGSGSSTPAAPRSRNSRGTARPRSSH